jgi:hypothetical protein
MFNTIILRFAAEKNKPNIFSDISNTILNLNELREIHIIGGCFTWSNNQVDPTLEKFIYLKPQESSLTTTPWLYLL